MHTNIWSQIVCNELMTHYDFDAHLERLRAIYREKSAFTMKLMNEHLVPNGITYLPIEGGLFPVVHAAGRRGHACLLQRRPCCARCGVVPGNAFLTNESDPCQSFRINYSTPTNEQLEKGIRILGQLASEVCR